MAKLYFRHGTVASAKTLNLLAVAHNYRQQGKEIILIKPHLDDRFGAEKIKSRAGLEKTADILVKEDSNLLERDFHGIDCILVDEIQFLHPNLIDQLREITLSENIPVIGYGLRMDFKTYLFPGSQRMMELADTIEEIKTTCAFCNKKAIYNLKHVNGIANIDGPTVDLGAEEKYYPACHSCYKSQLSQATITMPLHRAALETLK